MIDICMALDLLPHTGVRTIEIPGFSGRRYFNRAAKTLIAPTQYRQLRRYFNRACMYVCMYVCMCLKLLVCFC